MLAALSEITGWEVKREVPSEILTKEDFAKQVEDAIENSQDDEEMRAAELALKMFGLTPWDFDLTRASADLIEEQAAAFYDFDEKRLYILDSTSGGLEQQQALVHELAHALADQHYSLGDYLKDAEGDDEATAREAVIEGQASWLSFAYLAYKISGSPEVPALLLDRLASATGADGDQYPVFSQAPLYLRESLIFPYTQGMRFQDAIYRELGPRAFDYIFQRPPRSTQQILHPEAYGLAAKPAHPELPDLGQAMGGESRRFRELMEGDIGEFDFEILLRQYLAGTGDDAASHWKGGAFRLLEHRDEKYPVLEHASEWDSEESAAEFFHLYEEVLRAKWKRMEIRSSTPEEVLGTGDTGDFLLRLDGRLVQSIEGMRAPGSQLAE